MIRLKEINKNYIPISQIPKERYWRQPDRSEIIVDDTHALMSLSAFNELQDYPEKYHAYRYVGKMCRDKDLFYWYGHHRDENMVSLHFRRILTL